MKNHNLPSDVSRCIGVEADAACLSCARRRQIERDDPARWYPMMGGIWPGSGRWCGYRIPELERDDESH
jgi:hypothetical protein